ncbi:hypothetical protein Sros01_80090 [Streptomyces roseochromogenus]|nr:hypothetical protein Sros01_80090 [Streptomyces roseochromogenus]
MGVGPLRFGMDSDEVVAALGGPLFGGGQVSADGLFWARYQETGLTCIYDRGKVLVAVAIDPLEGPLVQVGEVELIGRVPSELRTEIHALAYREGLAVGVNWVGDPEVAAWGCRWAPRRNTGCLPRVTYSGRTRWSPLSCWSGPSSPTTLLRQHPSCTGAMPVNAEEIRGPGR